MNDFDLQVRIDQQRETIGGLQEQIEERDDRIRELEAEVARLKEETEALRLGAADNREWAQAAEHDMKAAAADLKIADDALHDLDEKLHQAEAEVARLHHGAHRWNTVESDGVLQICRGDHERGTDCEYERWVPEAKLRAVGELPGKWRSEPCGTIQALTTNRMNADELEALLKGDS